MADTLQAGLQVGKIEDWLISNHMYLPLNSERVVQAYTSL
jgi:hypothetical protein